MPDNALLATEVTVLALLVVIIFVALFARVVRIPYTTILVLAGLLLASLGFVPRITLTPDLVLLLFLPPLAFEAAFHLELTNLRRDLAPVALLALIGVIITMAVAGGVLALALGWDVGIALLFGALIAATDPVSVVAVFRQLGVPRRLSTIIEGESLFNDGTGIVLFRIVLAILIANTFDPASSILEFLRLVAGGALLGGAIGLIGSRLLVHIDDYLVEISVTVVLAWGTFLLAENEIVHVSGVIAVVVAGLVLGNYGGRVSFSPTTKVVLTHVLEFIAFVANSLVFLLIGLQVNWSLIRENWQAMVWAIAATLLARAAAVYGLTLPLQLLQRPLPARWSHIIFWGGLRGGLSLALALSLPDDIPFRSTLVVCVFGVVLFTLVAQAMTIQPLLRRLGLVPRSSMSAAEHDVTRARLIAVQAAQRRVGRLSELGLLSQEAFEALYAQYAVRENELRESLHALHRDHPDLTERELGRARLEGLRAERAELLDLKQRGEISDSVYHELATDIDAQLNALRDVKGEKGQ